MAEAGALACSFSGGIDVGRLERQLLAALSKGEGDLLDLDLRNVTFIEPIALLYLFATLVDRSSRELGTELRLPEKRLVRDFLRAWNFDAALKQATGRSLRYFVSEDDYSYFGEEQQHYAGRKATGSEEYLASQRFFGVTPQAVGPPETHIRLVEREWRRWQDPLVLDVLSRLQGTPEDIARVVVYEALTNAVQHPASTWVAVISSARSDNADGRVKDRFFQLGVWDDGESIIQTLKKAARFGPVRAREPTTVDSFEVKAVGWKNSRACYRSDWTPSSQASSAEWLLASLFQGISQKPVRRDIKDIHMPGDQTERKSGDGLHALYRSVVNDFGGSLAVRTGSYFMNVRAAGTSPAHTYKAKIQYFDNWPKFPGNMITVRVPLTSVT